MIKELGEGGYGTVKLAVRKLLDREEFFAVKVLDKKKLKRKRNYIIVDGSNINIHWFIFIFLNINKLKNKNNNTINNYKFIYKIM